MVAHNRYSEWDGSQEPDALDPADVLDALSDDLMNFGDLEHAMRNLMQRGMQGPDGGEGLRDLLQRLRQERRDRLDRYDLGGVMEDVQRQLEEILDLERSTIDQRLGEIDPGHSDHPDQGAAGADPDASEQSGGQQSDQQPGDQQPGGQQPGDQQPSGQRPGGQRLGGQQPGDQQPGGQRPGDAEPGEFDDMLRRIAERKRDFLRDLPPDPAGQMEGLRDYEFLSPEAQHRFQELLDQLREAMTRSFFNDVEQMVQEMSEGDIERMKDMVRDLNDLMVQRMRGEEPDFDQFMDQYGDMFGPNPPESLDDLIEQMQAQMQATQSLLQSMPPDQRAQLEQLMADKLGDPELEAELSQLAANMEYLQPGGQRTPSYPFRGEEEIDLQAAMSLMQEMGRLDELEQQIERAQYDQALDGIDADALRDLLGEDAADSLEQLQQLLRAMEDAGYVRKRDGEWELTPRGSRTIGQRALQEIFRQLRDGGLGGHALPRAGRYGERTEDHKPYEFGDPFHLHMGRTIMNAVERTGASTPVDLDPDDFAIYRSESVTQTATVVMVDLSWSMALRGSFQAAKKVALALHNLISMQYQRDELYVIGFSAYARELEIHDLPYVRWDESVLGTNMHHALILARKLLARHPMGTRQIIMISDGEPTAHLEHGRSQFSYPPSPQTIRETLKEVQRCTRERITINTFMLDRSYHLKEFVNQLTRINRGRVFYTTPDELGEYILVDYLEQKRTRVAR